MSIEAVEALLDETQEALEEQREIDALLTGSLTPQFEDELENELADLIAEEKGTTTTEPARKVGEESGKTTTTQQQQAEARRLAELAQLEELESLNVPSHQLVVTETREATLAE